VSDQTGRAGPASASTPTATATAAGVDRRSNLPLYVQIRNALERIISEEAPGGDTPGDEGWAGRRFYSDAEIADRFNVSRMTARQAIGLLVDSGHLYRIRGKGTFVGAPKVADSADALEDFFEEWQAAGHAVSAVIAEFRRQPLEARNAAPLQRPVGEEVLFIQRIRSVDDIPVAVDYRYVPFPLAGMVNQGDLLHGALHTSIGKQLKVPISYGSVEYAAGQPSPAEAKILKMGQADPVFVRTATIFDEAGDALWTGRSVYRGDRYTRRFIVPAS
jgi:GntR family transcriptional regulator